MAFAGWRSGVAVGAALLLVAAGMAEAGNRGGGGRGCGNGGGNWNRGCGNGWGGSRSSFSIGFSSGGGCWSGSSVAFGFSSGSRCGPSTSWGFSSWSQPCRPVFVQPCRTWVPAYGYCAVPTTCSPRWVVAQPCAPVFVAPRPVCATPVYGSPTVILTDSGASASQPMTRLADTSTVQPARYTPTPSRAADYRAWQIETELAARAKAADAANALAEKTTVREPSVHFAYVVESPKVERQVTHTTAVATRAPLPEPAPTTTTTTTTTAVASR